VKTMFLAVAAGLLLLQGAARSEPIKSDQLRNEPQEAAISSRTPQRSQAWNQPQTANPTGSRPTSCALTV
jgi:hypothetical protein